MEKRNVDARRRMRCEWERLNRLPACAGIESGETVAPLEEVMGTVA